MYSTWFYMIKCQGNSFLWQEACLLIYMFKHVVLYVWTTFVRLIRLLARKMLHLSENTRNLSMIQYGIYHIKITRFPEIVISIRDSYTTHMLCIFSKRLWYFYVVAKKGSYVKYLMYKNNTFYVNCNIYGEEYYFKW